MIRNVAVLGAGTMGAQIAGHAANAGLQVLLLDVTEEQVHAGLKALEKSSPAALFVPENIRQVRVGTFDKDLARIKECHWICVRSRDDLDQLHVPWWIEEVRPEPMPPEILTAIFR